VTYAHKIEKAEADIDWALPAEVLARRVRAFDPFPGAVTRQPDGATLKVWAASALPQAGGAPGTVLAVSETGVDVACGEGALRLTELQRAGGKRLPVAEFLRGSPLAPGQLLGAPCS
jgi:methionyl-tRNA formyltransferase